VPYLIGLNGRRGSGKNTAAEFISEWASRRDLTTRSRGFADKLKHSALTALGFQVTEQDAIVLADELKTLGEVSTIIPNQSVYYAIEGRKFLQLFGTEAHRDIFGDNFWVDALLPHGLSRFDQNVPAWYDNFTYKVDENSYDYVDIACVTDVRFPNEAQRILNLGGQVWEIDRPLDEERDDHASEKPLPRELITLTIPNFEGIEEFESNVHAVCTGELHMKIVKGIL
jgi:hypothetical protein